MSETFTFGQVQALADLLDPNQQVAREAAGDVQRPASQRCGFSLHEAPAPERARPSGGAAITSSSSSSSHQEAGGGAASVDPAMSSSTAANAPTGAPLNPGLVSLPPHLAHKAEAQRAGLPVPSQTQEGRQLAAEKAAAATRQNKPQPKGNDIWAEEEVDRAFGAAAGGGRIGAAPRRAAAAPPTTTTNANTSNSATENNNNNEQQNNNAATTTSTAVATTVNNNNNNSNNNNGLETPEYTISFKQQLRAEDRFLAMDFTRDGSTNTADGIVVRITLPKHNAARDINLDVQEEELSLLSQFYMLKVQLPMKVLAASAAATWDRRKHELAVTLRADVSKREFMLM